MKKDYLENIKSIRTDKGINQSQMDERLGFTQNNYSKIERGLGELTVDRLYEIAKILDVSVFQILIDKDIEILQEKIKKEIETKKRKEFNAEELERLKEKYKNEFEIELKESVKNWLNDIENEINNYKHIPPKPKSKEEIAEARNKRFKGYKE